MERPLYRLVLTAGNKKQAENYDSILGQIDHRLFNYARFLDVHPDETDVKIGAGGSTIQYLQKLTSSYTSEYLQDKKVLLIHSGGYSQRTPHLSTRGKIFTTFPNNAYLIDLKLESIRNVLCLLPPGLIISACDVIEDCSSLNISSFDSSSDMIIFAHQSSLEIAKGHGVFVMDGNKLKCVLQKPTIDDMIESGAILPSGNAFTDSFYWISWRMCHLLINNIDNRPITDELCCYGDYMRPLGSNPRIDYIKQGSSALQEWRQLLFNTFQQARNVHIIDLGPDSFYHFGTVPEFLDNINICSSFAKKFLAKSSSTIYSRVKQVDVR